MGDLIYRQNAIDAICSVCGNDCDKSEFVYNAPQDEQVIMCPEHYALSTLPSAEPEIIRCKNCKYWKQQTNYIGVPLSFGFCENDNMWGLLYGETCEVSHIDTDDDFYCGYAERRGEQE